MDRERARSVKEAIMLPIYYPQTTCLLMVQNAVDLLMAKWLFQIIPSSETDTFVKTGIVLSVFVSAAIVSSRRIIDQR